MLTERDAELKESQSALREMEAALHLEAALERVRFRAMAMRESDQLRQVVATVFKELNGLDFDIERCLIWVFNRDDESAEIWMADRAREYLPESYFIPSGQIPLYRAFVSAWKDGIPSLVYTLAGKDKAETDDFFFITSGFSALPAAVQEAMRAPKEIVLSASFTRFGAIQTAGLEPLEADNLDILHRFGNVLDLTYTRFDDLQRAEARAREARTEAALERVRSRAMAMQEPEELEEVVNVMRDEFGALGMDELETSSIFLQEQGGEALRCWFAIMGEDGRVSGELDFEVEATEISRRMGEFFETDEENISIPMTGEARREWIAYAYEHAPAFRGFYGSDIPDRTYHLERFSHGAIAAATPGDLSPESWSVLRRAAGVFELAYARFRDLHQARDDLRKLKEEKARTEQALKELKATQKQLVEQEKLASLGSLTAGIAHEIKNPLNFVNNFAEVNAELADELEEAAGSGDTEEFASILADLRDNAAQIAKHGKRADSIVRSMMQHARGGASEAEIIDVNNFIEEYVSLAWHGMRAKDHEFQGEVERDYADDVGSIIGQPQELGRVILNLLNNAFYAVMMEGASTPPTIFVATRRLSDSVSITIADNGPGILPAVREKIFEPFFTTKPTGEGTGLGLSLSYDIITKGHGGTMAAGASASGGAEFVITLPG